MIKLTLSVVLAAATSTLAYAQITIPVGGLCAGFAGPLPWPCAPGSTCCAVGPDRALCTLGSSCPSQFVPVGGLCSGFAGPSPYPCNFSSERSFSPPELTQKSFRRLAWDKVLLCQPRQLSVGSSIALKCSYSN
ncbi:hypothetical protein BJ165DRAFT_1528004 [Panaeolus papilionaceus]|nr:hypothetical protein BJ165DRAFT_1528004 [Panaeolus papilionaceus]